MGLIYKIENNTNGKCYIGQTTQKLKQRIAKHLTAVRSGSSQLIHKAIRKYGIESFTISVVKSCKDRSELDIFEDKMIKKYNTMVPTGYNLKSGGHNVVYSKESKLKMSLAHKGVALSDEHKKKISESQIGRPGPWKGKKFTKKHRDNISKGNIGRKFTKETKLKISKALTGNNNGMFGKVGGLNPNAKQITLLRPDGEIEHFESLTTACNKYGLEIRNLSAVINGKRRSHKGFRLQDKSIG